MVSMQRIAAGHFARRISWIGSRGSMNFIASKGQLRASFLRWALFTVPLILLLGFVAGNSGGPGTIWFADLAKPSIFPDPMWFGIVWTVLYLMIGLALAFICSAWGARGRIMAIIFFLIHFIFNLAWTPTFFGAQNIEGGLYVIALANATLLVVIWAFWRVRRVAALLLLPYLAWLAFAGVLNYEFHRLNPEGGHGILLEQSQRFEI